MTFIHIFRQETTIADWNGVCEWKQACCRAIATEQNGCWQHVESLQRRTYPPRALLGWLVKEPSFKEAQVCNNAYRKCKTLSLIRFITCWNMSKTVEQVQSWPSCFGRLKHPREEQTSLCCAGLPASNISPHFFFSYGFNSVEVFEAELFCFCLLFFFLALSLPLSLSLCSASPL